MIYITRRAEFSASHYYHNPELSAEENQRIFGKCANPHGHGHNYALEVTVAGEVDPRTGMVMDLKDLKQVIESEIMQAMDHRFLNEEVPAFRAVIPTTENIAVEIWTRLEGRIAAGRLHRVRLYETADLYVDYYGA
ncbi:MAG TPA: 6-carboxytetrahydropterin synthase [Terriglobia bacterium]|nr:6-carboxytetrahydropterin synthase [Terriglobia bacterium]